MRRSIWVAAGAVFAGWLVSFGLVARAARRDLARPADAIVVLGAAQYNGRPSPVLKARLDHAADLYRSGLAPQIVVTGGVGVRDTVSEAAASQHYLLTEAGLPPSVVTVEATGNTTEASLRAVALGAPAHWHVILVSDGFHMLRLGIIARRLGLESYGSPAPTSPIRASRRRELGYLLAESVKAPVAFLLTRSE